MAGRHELSENPPGHGGDAEPTVLVSGQTRALLRRIPLQLLDERVQSGDGAVVLTTSEEPATVGRRLSGGVEALEHENVAIVDCATERRSPVTRTTALRWNVPSPVSFPQVSEALREALDTLAERRVPRTHVLCDTTTAQFRLAAPDRVVQSTHDVAMSVGGERGLGVFVFDATSVPDRQVERLQHLFDVHVEVGRRGGSSEVRWTGLVGRSDGWVPLADVAHASTHLGIP